MMNLVVVVELSRRLLQSSLNGFAKIPSQNPAWDCKSFFSTNCEQSVVNHFCLRHHLLHLFLNYALYYIFTINHLSSDNVVRWRAWDYESFKSVIKECSKAISRSMQHLRWLIIAWFHGLERWQNFSANQNFEGVGAECLRRGL